MSDAFWMGLFNMIPIVLGVYLLHRRLSAVERQNDVIKENITIIEKATNSIVKTQVDLAGQLGLAEGEKKGRADKTAEIKQEREVKKQ